MAPFPCVAPSSTIASERLSLSEEVNEEVSESWRLRPVESSLLLSSSRLDILILFLTSLEVKRTQDRSLWMEDTVTLGPYICIYCLVLIWTTHGNHFIHSWWEKIFRTKVIEVQPHSDMALFLFLLWFLSFHSTASRRQRDSILWFEIMYQLNVYFSITL